MIIDVHAHPLLFDVINENPEDLNFRKQEFGVFKSGINPVDFEMTLLADAQIDKVVLLPEDYSAESGRPIVSNDEMAKIVDKSPEHFIGFASVDPRKAEAKEELLRAFDELGLMGLKLNPAKQRFYPDDRMMWPIYEKCLEYGRPILFHAGLSWEPQTLCKYSHPLRF